MDTIMRIIHAVDSYCLEQFITLMFDAYTGIFIKELENSVAVTTYS